MADTPDKMLLHGKIELEFIFSCANPDDELAAKWNAMITDAINSVFDVIPAHLVREQSELRELIPGDVIDPSSL